MNACAGKSAVEISTPDLPADFYQLALAQIDEDIEADPSNEQLLNQKLYYCEETGFPSTCLQALDQLKARKINDVLSSTR